MIELSNVPLPLDAGLLEGQSLVRAVAAKACGVGKRQVVDVILLRRGVDARKRDNVHFVATLGVQLANPKDEQRILRKGAASIRRIVVVHDDLGIRQFAMEITNDPLDCQCLVVTRQKN